jgi:hypothetical protein
MKVTVEIDRDDLPKLKHIEHTVVALFLKDAREVSGITPAIRDHARVLVEALDYEDVEAKDKLLEFIDSLIDDDIFAG